MAALDGQTKISGRFPGGWWWRIAALAAALLAGPAGVKAQDEVRKPGKTEEVVAPAAPEDISLPTASGLELAATYYAGTKGKDSVPVVLLHGFKGSRKDYADLAPYLREKLGCAVLVPDLRGHGESTKLKNGGTLTADKMRPLQFQAIITEDMIAILDFLRQENNGLDKKPRLNLNKLCLVGADMGADVALEFARFDWSQRPVGKWQTGGFTKALVLLSPEWSSHGLKLGAALVHPDVRSRISVLLVVGKDSPKYMSDARRVNKMLEPFHPTPPPDKTEQRTLYFLKDLHTNLQGTKLVEEKSLGVPELIEQFIRRRLIKSDEARSYKWQRLRRDPYVPEKGE
jgi:pimeloyl-ACP methyl ester carboxylesterase